MVAHGFYFALKFETDWYINWLSYIFHSLTDMLSALNWVLHTKHTKDLGCFLLVYIEASCDGRIPTLSVSDSRKKAVPCFPLWFETDEIVFSIDQKSKLSNFKPLGFMVLFSLGNRCVLVNNGPICSPHWELSLMMLCTELI